MTALLTASEMTDALRTSRSGFWRLRAEHAAILAPAIVVNERPLWTCGQLEALVGLLAATYTPDEAAGIAHNERQGVSIRVAFEAQREREEAAETARQALALAKRAIAMAGGQA